MLQMNVIHLLAFVHFHIGYRLLTLHVAAARVHCERSQCGLRVQKDCQYLYVHRLSKFFENVPQGMVCRRRCSRMRQPLNNFSVHQIGLPSILAVLH